MLKDASIKLSFHLLSVQAPEGYKVKVVGNIEGLSHWETTQGVELDTEVLCDRWHVEYKYIYVSGTSGDVIWEDGENRVIDLK
jgi:hypothetical protein